MANVPIQSLIDHIKTAIDVDPWAKEMAEELLKKQEPKRMWLCNGELCCPQCGAICKSYYHYCDECGQAVKCNDLGVL